MFNRIRYAVGLFIATAVVTTSLIIWFHWTKEKGLPLRYLNELCYLAIRSGLRIFSGPFTKGMERLSEVYIVFVTSLQGAALGLGLDYLRYRLRVGRHTTPQEEARVS
jgi:hypothetical protein